jgi:hypothetical protein
MSMSVSVNNTLQLGCLLPLVLTGTVPEANYKVNIRGVIPSKAAHWMQYPNFNQQIGQQG